MDADPRRPRPLAVLAVVLTAAALLCAGFVALGAWQVQRLQWKQALIERIERNLQAPPVPAPASAAPDDEYRRVRVQGQFDFGRQVLVRATTTLGAGYWVLTPLRTDGGTWVLVNRGFVPPELRTQVPAGEETQAVTGLLRHSEPGGGLLQDNEPAAGRWYSRDVAAIAATQGLQGPVAPYFVDAQAAGPADASAWPRPGLTVIRFANNHLVYALTWFVLAAIMAAAMGFLVLHERRLRRQAGAASLVDPQS